MDTSDDHLLRLKNRVKNNNLRIENSLPKINIAPINLIKKCFSPNPAEADASLSDLCYYLILQCKNDDFEQFCEVFPYNQFLEFILSIPEGKIRQKALLIFSECSNSSFFPAETYASNPQIISFFYSLLESSIKDEIAFALQILSQIMLACPSICQFLVEKQGIHSELELIEATPQLSKMLAVLSDVHPQSIDCTLSIIPFCLETGDSQIIAYSLLAMLEAVKKVPESSSIVICMVDRYSKVLFSFDINQIDENGPYSNEIINSNTLNEDKNYDEENIQLVLQIISIVPVAPPSLITPVFNVLLSCKYKKTILLCNLALRKQKLNWRGVEFIDDMLCMILQGSMQNQTYEVKKSYFETFAVYYQWEKEINIPIMQELIGFIEDCDLKSTCLFILCNVIEIFIPKKSESPDFERSFSDLCSLIKSSAIPVIEKIAVDGEETDENALFANKFLSIFQESENKIK